MTARITMKDAAAAAAAIKPDLSYLPTYNVTGGRPTERFGTRGRFTPGVRIMAGGPAREIAHEAEVVDHGKVLFVSTSLKPDMSYLPTYNVAGGRPTERFSTRGSFARGVCTMVGGAPRDVPLEAEVVDHGKVLFVSSTLKPDLSCEARTNVAGARPTERFGTRGSFTPGTKRFRGGAPRDVPMEAEFVDHGKVLFESCTLKPDLSGEARTNVAGGRPTERLGSRGGFTPGVRIMAGGPARDVLQLAEIADHGKVLFESSILKPDMSYLPTFNVAGGRPTERLGSRGRFTPGTTTFRGGAPHDFPFEAETADHGTVLFPPQQPQAHFTSPFATIVAESPPTDNAIAVDADAGGDGADAWFFEAEDITMEETCQANDNAAFSSWEKTTMAMGRKNSSSLNDLAGGGSDGVFRRCGSDSEFNAGAALLKDACRSAF